MPAPQEAAFLAALKEIDPELVAKPDRALRRGRNVCFDLATGKPRETVVDNTRQRYDGGHATVSTAAATRIVAAVEASGLLALYEAQGGTAQDPGFGGLLGSLGGPG
jgi:hypothetical protein